MQRVAFTESRAKEYFILDDLIKQTSMPEDRFLDVIIKELIDNALDEAESNGIYPEVSVEVDYADAEAEGKKMLNIQVSDNGPGMPAELIKIYWISIAGQAQKWPYVPRCEEPRAMH